MIPATGYEAVYGEPRHRRLVPVAAWDDDGYALVSDDTGRLVRANGLDGFACVQPATSIRPMSAPDTTRRAILRVLKNLEPNEWITGSELRRRIAARSRPNFDEAVSTLGGRVESEPVEYRGMAGVRYRLRQTDTDTTGPT